MTIADLVHRLQDTRNLPAAFQALKAMRYELDVNEERLVRAARRQGWSWSQLGWALGMSRQGATKRWRAVLDPSLPRAD